MPKATDTIQIAVFHGNTYTSCDMAISGATAALDAIERRIRRETTKLAGRRLDHEELTDAIARATAMATRDDADPVIALATWVAVRGAHSAIRLEDLKKTKGGTLVVASDDPHGAGPSWKCSLSPRRLDVVAIPLDEMSIH
jgi:hypothetical protein